MHARTVFSGVAFLLLCVSAANAQVLLDRALGGTNNDFATAVKATSDSGFVLAGYSYSALSGSKTNPPIGGGDGWLVKLDASGAKLWDKCYGGTNFDRITTVQQTSDGGFILGGCSYSPASGNKTSAHYGAGDYWVVKTDAAGNKQWDKSFGGTNLDALTALQQTADGGYIVGGYSFSGASGNKSAPSYSPDLADYWVLKLDSNGNKVWEASYGGSDADELQALQQTRDGGYLLGGSSFSGASGNKTSSNLGINGTSDYWVIKLDSNGGKQWERTFGGNDADILTGLQQTTDGYVLGGYSYSTPSGNKTAANLGGFDFWLVKLDASGNKQWDSTYGGNDLDELYTVEQTGDGGFLLSGISLSATTSTKTATTTATNASDFWLVKVDARGTRQWDRAVAASFPGEWLRHSSCDGACAIAGLNSMAAAGDLDFSLTRVRGPVFLHSYSASTNRAWQGKASGVSGSNYVLEATTNFAAWTSVLTNRATNAVVDFRHTNSSGPNYRTYRVREQ